MSAQSPLRGNAMDTIFGMRRRYAFFYRSCLWRASLFVRNTKIPWKAKSRGLFRFSLGHPGLFAILCFASLASPCRADPKVFVYFSGPSTATVQFQSDFLGAVTTQFQGVLLPSIIPGQYVFTISGEGPQQMPPDAFSDACAYCFGNGMTEERSQDKGILYGMQAVDFSSGTCGGYEIPVDVSSATCENACLSVYSQAVSTISIRDFDVFNDTGGKVSGL